MLRSDYYYTPFIWYAFNLVRGTNTLTALDGGSQVMYSSYPLPFKVEQPLFISSLPGVVPTKAEIAIVGCILTRYIRFLMVNFELKHYECYLCEQVRTEGSNAPVKNCYRQSLCPRTRSTQVGDRAVRLKLKLFVFHWCCASYRPHQHPVRPGPGR